MICLLVVLSRSKIKYLKQIVKEQFFAGAEVGESLHMKAVGVVYSLESFLSNYKHSCLCTKSFVDKQGWGRRGEGAGGGGGEALAP